MRTLALLPCALSLLLRQQLAALQRALRFGAPNSTATLGGPIIADGFSRVACVVDESPSSVHWPYDDYNMRRPKMSPTECFTFCRDKAKMRFFMIAHGRDCYCTEYYHDVTAGGGDCNLPCEGDFDEMCGGQVKASAFEMHLCGKSGSIADAAATSARAEAKKANATANGGYLAYLDFANISASWKLGVCSKAPEVCDMSAEWLTAAHEMRDVSVRAYEAMNASLHAADDIDAAKKAGFNTTDDATALEAAVQAGRDEISATAVAAQNVEMALQRLAGPLGSAPELADWQGLFTTASTLDNETQPYAAVCTLKRLPGKSFVKQIEKIEPPPSPPPDYVPPPPPRSYPAACADACVAAGADCVGFNFQVVNGAAACQLLGDSSYVPAMSLAKRFGVIEVSELKVAVLGYERIGCYVQEAFLAKDGGIKADVLAVVYNGTVVDGR